MFCRTSSPPAFTFLDPAPLVDGELELVAPAPQWVDAVVAACHHPQTIRFAPEHARTDRQQLLDYLQACPGGHQPADPAHGIAPAYHFWMRIAGDAGHTVTMAGGMGLRIGVSADLEWYLGHIGYHVYPPSQGHHYAERAVRLVLPLARHHGMRTLWITCNPDNFGSRRTCERLGASLVDIVPVPTAHPLYVRGDRQKCRYRLEL